MNEKSYTEKLPNNYQQRMEIDLNKNKKLAVWVNLSSILLLLPFASFYYIFFFKPFAIPKISSLIINSIVFIFGLIAAIILHEAIHGITFKAYSPKAKIKFGFTGLYAYAGNSSGYYYKNAYNTIAIMPCVCITLALIITLFFVRNYSDIFFVIYAIMSIHFTACFGDFYVCFVLSKLPNHTYILDNGTSMNLYVRHISKKK